MNNMVSTKNPETGCIVTYVVSGELRPLFPEPDPNISLSFGMLNMKTGKFVPVPQTAKPYSMLHVAESLKIML